MQDAKTINKPVKTITVSGKEFKISFISTYTHMMVKELGECFVKANKLMEQYEKLDKESPVYQEKATQVIKEMEEINSRDVISERLDLIQHVLEDSNNIPFDRNWWLKKTSVKDLNNFLYDCLHKDWDKKKEQ